MIHDHDRQVQEDDPSVPPAASFSTPRASDAGEDRAPPPRASTELIEHWRRAERGLHAAVVGMPPGEPPPSMNMRVVRLSCDVPATTLGPLVEARRKVERVLDETGPLLDGARRRVVAGLRKRLLGEGPVPDAEGELVATWNRLAPPSDRPTVLVLDAADAADATTLRTLRRILERSGWLRLPLVLSFRGAEPTGPAAEVVEALRATQGADAIIGPPPAAESRTAEATHPARFEWRSLSPDVVRVMRAGALVGSGFEADLVAALLALDPGDVLDALQRAADAGAPVEDRGEGRFHFGPELLEELRATTLPSLSLRWHRRMASLLLGSEETPGRSERAMGEPPPRPSAADETPRDAPPPPVDPPVAPPPATAAVEKDAAELAGPGRIFLDPSTWTAPFSGAPPAPTPPREPASPPREGAARWKDPGSAPPVAETHAAATPRSRDSIADEARAAAHLAAAGDLDAGAERYAAAAREAAGAGAFSQALAHVGRAIALLDRLPASPRRRRLRAATLLDSGRWQWQAAGPEGSFTLGDALETLEEARAAFTPDDPAPLRAEVSAAIAGVCYDIGDAASLERAIDELTEASRLLLAAGDASGAARLLNDQAAVYVRLGDPVRAAHLLTESRKIFERRAPSDPVAAIELAETDHLFARIPLHVAARPGREADALSAGLDHAIAAERTYRKLDATRDLGRVWETMGRLELRRGRIERATQHVEAAIRVEESVGDVIGLARSTAALSEVLAASGRTREALTLLADSIALNLEKGSPIGLAFNRRAFEALGREATPMGDAAPAFELVSDELRRAEALLGRIALGGEPDPVRRAWEPPPVDA